MKILFLPKHEYLGASSRYRTLQYLPYLKSQGVLFEVKPLFTDKYLNYKYKNGSENKLITLNRIAKRIKTILWDSSKFDVLVIEKELIPYFPPILEYYLRFKKIPYIVDYDDAVWHNYDQHRSFFVKKILGKKIQAVMRNAKIVIGGSDYIKEYASTLTADKVYKIPTVIDTSKYGDVIFKKHSKFIIGWIGSPSSSLYLLSLNNVLEEFTRNMNAEVHLIGFDKTLKSSLKFNYKIIEWSEETEVQNIQKFDVGIMPLPNTPFERGKCGFKLVQYMGCRKPVVASPVSENNIIVEHGINGFLAQTESEWLQFLNSLYNDNKYAQSLGQQGYKKVKRIYSLAENQKFYLELIKKSITN